MRSKEILFGFDPHDSCTSEHNRSAIRAAYVLWLAWAMRAWASNEQPGSSVMNRLDIFKRMQGSGYVARWWRVYSFGSPFQEPADG